MNKRPVQYFTPEYLEQCKKMTPDQIIQFLEDFRCLSATTHKPEKCKLISLRVEPSLLSAFKTKAKLNNQPYQTLIKQLMLDFILK